MANQGGEKKTGSSGLAPNIAGLLCYLCAPITSIIFLILEKENADVKFHAWQGTVFGVACIAISVLLSILGAILGAIASFLGALIAIIYPIFWLVAIVVWIVCMVKAYQGERWRIPVLGDFAADKAGV
ncbi:MAG: DUF4870 domain-containing protein [Pseudomonadota bacterium]